MSYGVWMAATGMKVSEYRQTLLANNLANVNTPGFKHDLAVIRQRTVESRAGGRTVRFAHPVLDQLSGGADVRQPHYSQIQGPVEQTGEPLDIAIQGDGFFAVSDGERTRYTRNGAFATNTRGEVVLSSGGGRWRLLDDSGRPIRVDREAAAPRFASDGSIRQGDTVVAKPALMAPVGEAVLLKAGETLFDARGADMAPVAGRFDPQALEGSTVDVMQGLASMIEAARAYQLNASMIQMHDQITGQLINTVGRLA